MPEPDVQMISGRYYVIEERRVESEGQPITYYFGKYDTKSGNNYKFDDLIQYNESVNNFMQINLEPTEFSSDTYRFKLTSQVDGKKKSHKKKSHKKKLRKKKIKKSLRKY